MPITECAHVGLNPIVINTDLKQLDSQTLRLEEKRSPTDSSRVEMKQLQSKIKNKKNKKKTEENSKVEPTPIFPSEKVSMTCEIRKQITMLHKVTAVNSCQRKNVHIVYKLKKQTLPGLN